VGTKSLELQIRCGWSAKDLLPAQLLILIIRLAFQWLWFFLFKQDN